RQGLDPLKGGHRPHLEELLGTPGPHLAPAPDQKHAEVEPLTDQQPVPLLEDAQWEHRAGEQHRVQGKERNQRRLVRGAAARQRSIQLPITSLSALPSPSALTASSTRCVNARDPSPLWASNGLPKRTSTGAGRKYRRPFGMTR